MYQKGHVLTAVQKHRPTAVEAGSPVVEPGVPVLRGNALESENMRFARSDLSSIQSFFIPYRSHGKRVGCRTPCLLFTHFSVLCVESI